MAQAPLPWFTFNDHNGRQWRVGLSCEDDSAVLADFHGITYFETAAVLIDAEQTRDEQDEITLHELMHVAYCDANPRFNETEEAVILRTAPRLLKILRQFGLRFPRRPSGVAELERRARGEEDGEESE